MAAIEGLGHVAIHCEDIMRMRDFYTRVLGLTISDEDLERRGMCFLSADPAQEHHEFVLAKGRDVPRDGTLVNQISFKVKSLDDVRVFYHRVKAEGMRIQGAVSHGNALGFYFYDPEDNRIELYYKTGYKVGQPNYHPIDLEKPNEELLAFARSFEAS